MKDIPDSTLDRQTNLVQMPILSTFHYQANIPPALNHPRSRPWQLEMTPVAQSMFKLITYSLYPSSIANLFPSKFQSHTLLSPLLLSHLIFKHFSPLGTNKHILQTRVLSLMVWDKIYLGKTSLNCVILWVS